jgi:hypothetical protein
MRRPTRSGLQGIPTGSGSGRGLAGRRKLFPLRCGRARARVRCDRGAVSESPWALGLRLSRPAIAGEQLANVLLDAGLPFGLLRCVARVHHLRDSLRVRLLLDGLYVIEWALDMGSVSHCPESLGEPLAGGYPLPVRTRLSTRVCGADRAVIGARRALGADAWPVLYQSPHGAGGLLGQEVRRPVDGF